VNQQKHGGAQESFRATVKPLEWEELGGGEMHRAQGLHFVYKIRKRSESVRAGIDDFWGIFEFQKTFFLVNDGKDYCQADHDKRVRALLNIEDDNA